MDHDGLIPCFARVTEGKISENEIARKFNPPKGSVVVFDKGYNSYRWHNSLTEKGIYWVTRIRGNAQYKVLHENKSIKASSILYDRVIKYSSSQRSTQEFNPTSLDRLQR